MTFNNAQQLEHRYLHGPASQVLVDEVFETVGGQQVSDEVLWQLGDQQGSVRDVVDDAGTLRKHVNYDSFGKITGEEFFAQDGTSVDATHAEAVDQLFYCVRSADHSCNCSGRWVILLAFWARR